MPETYKGVTFGSTHTSSYGLVLSKKSIESPQPKLATIDIPGGDGALDYTEYFGDVKYKNRKLKFDLSTDKVNAQLLTMYANVQNDLLGKHFDSIVLDDDPNYRYIGRVTGVSLASGDINRIVIDCECEPYKVGNTLITNTFLIGHIPGYTFNFGRKVVPITLTFSDSLCAEYWTLLIDNVAYRVYQNVSTATFAISGSHKIGVAPGISYTSGTLATISYPQTKL